MTLRLGLLGAARITPAAVIYAADAVPAVSVTAVAARDVARAAVFAQEHAIPAVSESYGELLARDDVDAVYIALPASHHLEWVDAAISDQTRVFHIGSLALIEGADADLWEQRFATLSANDVITSLDPNARPVVVKDKDQYVARLLRVMKHARVLKLSDEDLEYLAPDQPLMEAFEQICSEKQAAIIILTKGADGAVVRCGSAQFDVAAAQADPLVDTVGAGDTFMGTLLVEISKTGLSASKLGSIAKDELARIVTRAAKAAALNCQSAGCNPPYEQDL